MKIAVLGAGNGGQALAGFLGLQNIPVNLYDRNETKVNLLKKQGGIFLNGKINGFGRLKCVTNDIKKAVKDVEIILVATTATAHKYIAEQLSYCVEENQIIILNPGRTCGALEFKHVLYNCGCKKNVYIAEAQTLVYACRLITDGNVNIIGIKDKVLLSALPASDTEYVIHEIKKIFPCFVPAENVLHTSLENIGAIFHPCVILFNAATIERKNDFYFYRDMTPKIAEFIEQFDNERLSVGKAYGIELINVCDWISEAYKDTKGKTLCEKMRDNPAYYDIKAPTSIYTRQLMEDIPTGVLPIFELGKVAGLKMSLFESMINISSALLNYDFSKNGRTLDVVGLGHLDKRGILKKVING